MCYSHNQRPPIDKFLYQHQTTTSLEQPLKGGYVPYNNNLYGRPEGFFLEAFMPIRHHRCDGFAMFVSVLRCFVGAGHGAM